MVARFDRRLLGAKLEECLEQAEVDITAQTAMLESRLIAGNEELF